MNRQRGIRLYRPARAMGSIAVLVALSCGIGSSSAGIQGSGRLALVSAYGRITAFGSIFVGGVEYALSNARITADGQPLAASGLQVGEIVAVQGSLDSSGRSGAAASVAFTGDVVGPVVQVDVTRGSLTVLGQTVLVNDATLFAESLQPAGIAGLRSGTQVEVSAFPDASGNLVASRIDLTGGGQSLQVRGLVQTIDANARTFRINDLVVDYSGTMPAGTLANGSTATVRADEPPSAGVLHATRVQVSSGLGGAPGTRGQLEGLITSVATNNTFYVADQLVQVDSNTLLVLHGQALAPNLAVNVHGDFNASGVLVATQVIAKPHQARASRSPASP